MEEGGRPGVSKSGVKSKQEIFKTSNSVQFPH